MKTTSIKVGTTIKLYKVKSHFSQEFKIEDVIGKGGSCYVYTASYTDNENNKFIVRLKEYNPDRYVDFRDFENNLVVETFEHEYKIGMMRFEEGYQKQIFLSSKPELQNIISTVQDIYEGYNSKYIVMSCNNGITYSSIEKKESLYEAVSMIIAIAKSIKRLHDNGYLHLDIKPDNIFKYEETRDIVMLFDFDSIINIAELSNQSLKHLSYTQNWAAPELSQNSLSKIGIPTDIYSIGAILFYKIFNRVPNDSDRKNDSSWYFDQSDDYFEKIDPKVFKLLTTFFRKTLNANPNKRYLDCSNMIEFLNTLLPICSPNHYYLLNNYRLNTGYFFGRNNYLIQINTILKNNNFVFLTGMGGIGKSALAQQFISNQCSDYDIKIFAFYKKSFLDIIIDDYIIHINGFSRNEGETENQYFTRKMIELRKLVNDKVILIIDNFDDLLDTHMNEVITLGWKVIITTRLNVAQLKFPYIKIECLSVNEAHMLFNKITSSKYADDKKLNIILQTINYHTLTIELIAKQIINSCLSIETTIELLNTKGLLQIGTEDIFVEKDEIKYKKSISGILKEIFNVSQLNFNQKNIMHALCMLNPIGVLINDCKDWLNLESLNDINELDTKGWIAIDHVNDLILVHPLISEILRESSTSEYIQNMIYNINQSAKEFEKKKYKELMYLFSHVESLLIKIDKD